MMVGGRKKRLHDLVAAGRSHKPNLSFCYGLVAETDGDITGADVMLQLMIA